MSRAYACLAAEAVAAALAFSSVGCSSDNGAPDASVPAPDGGIAAPAPPSLPSIPWWSAETGAIALEIAAPARACPAGWRETTTPSGTRVCEPWPPSGRSTCPEGQAHFPGEPGCAPVGAPCPSGDFPEGLPTDRAILYVRAGATGGDGTLARPFGRVLDAVAAAAPGTIVAIAKGTYDEESVFVPTNVTLWGACTEATILTRSVHTLAAEGAVTVTAPGVTIRDLRIEGSAVMGLWVRGAGASATLEGVIVSTATMTGVLVEGAELSAHTVVIRDTRPRVRDGAAALGLGAGSSAHVQVSRAVIERNHGGGAASQEGASMTLEETAIVDNQPAPDGLLGVGAAVLPGSSLVVARSALEGNHRAGVYAGGAGTMLSVEDTIIRGTELDAEELGDGIVSTTGASAIARGVFIDGSRRLGVVAVDGASATIEDSVVLGSTSTGISASAGALSVARCVLEDNHVMGLGVDELGGKLDATDVTVRGTGPGETTIGFGAGYGLQVGSGAIAIVTRAWLEHNSSIGAWVGYEGRATLSDIVVRDTQPSLDGNWGDGIFVVQDGALVLRRAVLEQNRASGVAADGFEGGASMDIEDLVVRDTMAQGDGRAGYGLAVMKATAAAKRVLIERAQLAALVVTAGDVGPATAQIVDLTVRDTRPAPSGAAGYSVYTARASETHVTRALFEGSRDIAIVVIDPGTTTRLEDVVVRGTESRELSGAFGRGLIVQLGGAATVARAVFEDNRDTGVFVSGAGSSAVLEDIVIDDTRPQACASTDCADREAGNGVGAYLGGSISLTRFEIRRASLCGVHVALDGAIDAAQGTVADSAIGACVQIDGYDLGRLMRDVAYVGNGATLQATMLPVPDAAETVPVASTGAP